MVEDTTTKINKIFPFMFMLLLFPPTHSDDSSSSLSACRIHGHVYVNKVAGNFHITVGKYVSTMID